MITEILDIVKNEVSGTNAKGYVRRISQFHRIQASPGFREAADYCHNVFEKNGIDQVNTEKYIADGKKRYWTRSSFQEWSVESAELRITSPQYAQRVLCNFRDAPLSVIQRSISTPGDGIEAEIVLLEDGSEREDYEGKDVEGKIVLTDAHYGGGGVIQRVRDLAIDEFGAIGIITDGMQEYHYGEFVRNRMDVGDALNYTSWWWTGKEKNRCFGFVLSAKQGEELRKLIKDIERRKQLEEKVEEDDIVKVIAKVDAKFYDGTSECVTALIPGRELEDEEVIIVGHLCHPAPSANDNASGSGSILEAARALNKLIIDGELPQPKRSIRFLLVPEIYGSLTFLSSHEDDIPNMISGLCMDMVGEDQYLCNSTLLAERTPEALPSYVNCLITNIFEEMGKEYPHAGDKYSLYRWHVGPYSGGSDHMVFLDPTVNVAMPLLIQWPDRFYHTSFDTIDKVSAESLWRVATIAATYAYFIAKAGDKECLWLTNEIVHAAKMRVTKTIRNQITETVNKLTKPERENIEEEIVSTIKLLREKVSFIVDRETSTLKSLERLIDKKEESWFLNHIDELTTEIKEYGNKEFKMADEAIRVYAQKVGLRDLPKIKENELKDYEKEASRIIPIRKFMGPLDRRELASKMSDKDYDEYTNLIARSRARLRPGYIAIAMYWTDGKRNLLDIAKSVKLEIGEADIQVLLEYFKLLEKHGYIDFSTPITLNNKETK